MRNALFAGLFAAAVLAPTLLHAEQGQGTADPNAHIKDLNLGTYWYGAPIDKKALFGKVVLVEIWGS